MHVVSDTHCACITSPGTMWLQLPMTWMFPCKLRLILIVTLHSRQSFCSFLQQRLWTSTSYYTSRAQNYRVEISKRTASINGSSTLVIKSCILSSTIWAILGRMLWTSQGFWQTAIRWLQNWFFFSLFLLLYFYFLRFPSKWTTCKQILVSDCFVGNSY